MQKYEYLQHLIEKRLGPSVSRRPGDWSFYNNDTYHVYADVADCQHPIVALRLNFTDLHDKREDPHYIDDISF